MRIRNTFLTNVAMIALAAGWSLGTAAWADTITGSIATAPDSVNLNLSTAYAFYGVSGSFTPATDPSNIGNFSTLVASGGYTGTGSDSTYNLVTYNNGTTSATLSPNYSLAQDPSGSSVATVSITTTLFATNEYLSVYVSGYDDAPDFSATVGSASFALNNVVLPTTSDGDGTGQGHTFGVLELVVSGTVGETLTITGATDRNGVSNGNFSTVEISSVTAGSSTNAITGGLPVPNPPSISPTGGVPAGTNATLTEVLLPQVSNPPYTYQWQSNSVNVGVSVTSSSSTNVFSINTTGFAVGSYNYQVMVSNSIGSATSAPVVLNIVTLTPLPGTTLIPTVWWEADATNNVINNGAVAQLTDQSGHENNAVQDTQNGTPMPLFVSNDVNGLPALNFGGANCLISPTGATTGNSSHSIFIVASYTAISGQFRNGAVFYSDTAGVNQNSCLGVDPDSNTMWVGGYGQDNAPYVGGISLNGAGFNILGKIYTASSANYQGFVAGVQDVNASGATYNLGDTSVGLGKQYNNGSYWAGDIAEVIVFNSALSYSDLEAAQHYLADKYNLPLALPAISMTASWPFVTLGSNVAVTVTLPVLTTTTTVTITSDNPSVTGFSSTNLTFTLGDTNVQTFNVNILAVGTANLTATSSSYNNGTLAIGGLPVVPGVSLTQIAGGDPGEGFAPLPTDVGGVDFGSSTVTIQGVTFTAGNDTGENGIINGTFTVPQSFGFGSTPNDNGMATMLSASTFAYTGGTQYSAPITSPDQYDEYQFTGLTAGQTYQVDIFTVCDSNPRPTLAQVVGATTNSYIVPTETSPQDVVFDMTPDTNGDITVEWTFGSGPYNVGSNGNSGCVSGIALTTNPNTISIARSGSNLVLTWSSGGTLLQATSLLGPWTTNVNTSPYTVAPSGGQMFFKVQAP